MYQKLFIDSSIWIAFAVSAESRHSEAVTIMKSHTEAGVALFTSNDVIDETVTRLLYWTGLFKTELFYTNFLDNVRKGTVTQLWTDEILQNEAWYLIKKFSDHKLSLTDATSIALLRRFNLDAIVTFDEDFKKVGIPTIPV